jgi:hypothetical protein
MSRFKRELPEMPILCLAGVFRDIIADDTAKQGEIAMAWTPCVFYEDYVLHHTGTNIFTLLKQEHDGKWVISGVADVAREVATLSMESKDRSAATTAEPKK